jgi:hypothetical protein
MAGVRIKHNKRTKAEQEYVDAIIQNLSLKRLTDQEIVEYLQNEKQIEIARSTVTNSRRRTERQATAWYVELKQLQHKYIGAYKNRIDSLLSYQRQLQDIITNTKKDEIKIRAISALHSIEMDIFNLWKQLPELDIVDNARKQVQQLEQQQQEDPPLCDIEDVNGVEEIPEEDKKLWHNWIQCDGCKRYWRGQELLNYHKRMSPKTNCAIPNIE